MKTVTKDIGQFLGLLTQYDASQVPFGGAMSVKNLAQLELGRLRRIPGFAALTPVAVADMAIRIPLLAFVRRLVALDYSIAIAVGVASRAVANLTTGAVLSGPALNGGFDDPWTYTFYNQKHVFSGGGNAPQEITAATTYVALTGTNVPTGNLVQSFRDRLFVADIGAEEGIVRYTDVLTSVFAATNIVNTKEIPGKITALAVNAVGTDNVGIDTTLVIFKQTAMWSWNETSKDVLSQQIGTKALHTIRNTKAGMVFLGEDAGRYSVFLLPVGTIGEPKDIGEALHDVFNGANPLSNYHVACAAADGNFYKLFFSRADTPTANTYELWLDIRLLAQGQVVWYGVHKRGSVDAVVRTLSRLEAVRRGAAGSTVWFTEKALALTTGFLDMNGGTLLVELDLPLNVPPENQEKIFDLLELQLAREANTVSNSLNIELISEGVSYGTVSKDIYNAKLLGIVRLLVPLYAPNRTGLVARDARIRLTHTIDGRFDMLGGTVQYLVHEDENIREQTTNQ
jgi:hypothetical protein